MQTVAVTNVFSEVVKAAARRLKSSFRGIGGLNNSKNSPIPERNTIIHLGAEFLDRGFAIYSEASLGKSKSRVDLVASNGTTSTFVVEVKTFGTPNWKGLQGDAERAAQYTPTTWPRLDGTEPDAWWKGSSHWACVVIQSFPPRANRAWKSFIDGAPEGNEGFLPLTRFLRDRKAETGMVLVCERIFADTDPLYLLWASFPIKGD